MVIDSAKARKKIESIEDLPTLPTVASKIVSIANSPTTNATDVGALIMRDQSLTGKVLKLVNSSFYGFPKQIKTINHAIVILGFNKVKNVVLTASVFDLTKGRTSQRLDIGRFWEHSLGTAIGAQVFAQQVNSSIQPDDAFVGGLLHDFGKLILDFFLPKDYQPVIETCRKERTLLRAAEKEVLGFDHQMVGQWICERWKLPPSLLNAVRYHHLPNLAREERDMVASVHAGDIVCRSIGIGNGGDHSIPEFDEESIRQYGINAAFLTRFVESTISELKKAQEFFDLINS